MTNKELKIEFAPGAFDNFDGTQEELDELMAEIHRMVESGELEERAREITDEDFEELPDEVKEQLLRSFAEEEGEDLADEFKRKLQ